MEMHCPRLLLVPLLVLAWSAGGLTVHAQTPANPQTTVDPQAAAAASRMMPPELTARTKVAGNKIAQVQSGYTRNEQDNRTSSVDVNVHFLTPPPVPWEVQCFF